MIFYVEDWLKETMPWTTVLAKLIITISLKRECNLIVYIFDYQLSPLLCPWGFQRHSWPCIKFYVDLIVVYTCTIACLNLWILPALMINPSSLSQLWGLVSRELCRQLSSSDVIFLYTCTYRQIKSSKLAKGYWIMRPFLSSSFAARLKLPHLFVPSFSVLERRKVAT